jgi:hypothetical protein
MFIRGADDKYCSKTRGKRANLPSSVMRKEKYIMLVLRSRRCLKKFESCHWDCLVFCVLVELGRKNTFRHLCKHSIISNFLTRVKAGPTPTETNKIKTQLRPSPAVAHCAGTQSETDVALARTSTQDRVDRRTKILLKTGKHRKIVLLKNEPLNSFASYL